MPATPRFNMPFELGIAVAWSHINPKLHQWRVFEARQHRLTKSLSDLNGTDPYVHNGKVRGVLRALANAFSEQSQPEFKRLQSVYRQVARLAQPLRRQYGSLFEARSFNELTISAKTIADADA
jgi:hypothetical protein